MDNPALAPLPQVNTRVVLLVLASVQFMAIVDFMVIMPLEPDLAMDMALSPAQFGLIVSSYTYAAGIAGLVASLLLDRFARRPAFLTLFGGFLAGTFACGLAPDFLTLLAARFLTGAFGGVLGGMALAIIGDVFPEAKRGAATGILMTSFALASVLGVPLGLALGQNLGWHIPFYCIAILGLPILFLAARALPRLDAHVGKAARQRPLAHLRSTLMEPNHLRAFALTISIQFGGFAVLPFLSPFLVSNVGLPKGFLPLAYIVGGILTLVGAPLIGRLADRYGKLLVYRIVAPTTAIMMLLMTNLPPVPVAVAVLVMGAMMISNAGRMVPAMAMITSSVEPHRRGGFLGANAAVQHVASGLGASFAGMILVKAPNGTLEHFPVVGMIGAGVTLASLWFAGRLRSAEPPQSTPVEVTLAAAAQASVDAGEPLAEVQTF
jgi:MFS transporter, DHA1 family, inner membrane transport protein